MFKKLKKIYFKIYHLFKLIGIFIIVFGLQKNVHAEECINVLEYNNWLYYNNSTYFLVDNEEHTYRFNLDADSDYTLFFDNGNDNFSSIFNNTVTAISIYSYVGNSQAERDRLDNLNTNHFTINTGAKTNFSIRLISSANAPNTPFLDNNTHVIKLVKGSNVCTNSPIPPDPEPEENVYSNFLTIYLDRITYLAEGFTNNPYLIAMIGIIISWVVLELALKLFNLKGGHKK